jgi:hypothetical protein
MEIDPIFFLRDNCKFFLHIAMDDHHFGYHEKNSQRKYIALYHAWCQILMVFILNTQVFTQNLQVEILQFISI